MTAGSEILVTNSEAGGNGGAIYAVDPPLYFFDPSNDRSPQEPLRITNCRADKNGGALYLENRSERPRDDPRLYGFPLIAQHNHAGGNGGGK